MEELAWSANRPVFQTSRALYTITRLLLCYKLAWKASVCLVEISLLLCLRASLVCKWVLLIIIHLLPCYMLACKACLSLVIIYCVQS